MTQSFIKLTIAETQDGEPLDDPRVLLIETSVITHVEQNSDDTCEVFISDESYTVAETISEITSLLSRVALILEEP